MKARIPGKRGLSKGAKMAVEDYIDTYEKAVTRRILKLCCVALSKAWSNAAGRWEGV